MSHFLNQLVAYDEKIDAKLQKKHAIICYKTTPLTKD